jgi:hypothetical protein
MGITTNLERRRSDDSDICRSLTHLVLLDEDWLFSSVWLRLDCWMEVTKMNRLPKIRYRIAVTASCSVCHTSDSIRGTNHVRYACTMHYARTGLAIE